MRRLVGRECLGWASARIEGDHRSSRLLTKRTVRLVVLVVIDASTADGFEVRIAGIRVRQVRNASQIVAVSHADLEMVLVGHAARGSGSGAIGIRGLRAGQPMHAILSSLVVKEYVAFLIGHLAADPLVVDDAGAVVGRRPEQVVPAIIVIKCIEEHRSGYSASVYAQHTFDGASGQSSIPKRQLLGQLCAAV